MAEIDDGDAARNGLQVINASLFRMGTKSMAEAYKILGFRTHHALDNFSDTRWDLIEESAEAKWPNVPGARPRAPYTRCDWDRIWGSYNAVTDLASPFAIDLAAAYPEAKVVVVQRDFDTWWPSFQSENINWRFFRGAEFLNFVMTVFNIRAGNALSKTYLGLFDAMDAHEIERNARVTYQKYFEDIRSSVPATRRLEYKLGSGWEPLCTFLGKDVPNKPFPRLNDKREHKRKANSNFRIVVLSLTHRILPLIIGLIAIGFMTWFVRANNSERAMTLFF